MMMMFVFFMDKPEQASSRRCWGRISRFHGNDWNISGHFNIHRIYLQVFVSGLRFEPIHICHGVHSKCGYFDSYYLVLVFL